MINWNDIIICINFIHKFMYADIYVSMKNKFSVANLLAHNNISQICYCGQISLQSAAVNCSFLAILHI